MAQPSPGIGSESTQATPRARWCPRCQGSKRPSEAVCLACGITLKAQRADVLSRMDRDDLRLMRAALGSTDIVRRSGLDFTYDDLMDELTRREHVIVYDKEGGGGP